MANGLHTSSDPNSQQMNYSNTFGTYKQPVKDRSLLGISDTLTKQSFANDRQLPQSS